MPVWRITPVADPADGRWQDSDIWAEVIVEADSPGEARIAAAELDTPEIPESTQPNTPFARSRFADEKLYRVDRLKPEDLPDEAARRLSGSEPPVGGRVLAQRKRDAAD